MADASATAGVKMVTGDTKVVERGDGDGCYINTAGVGLLREGISVGPHRAMAGDAMRDRTRSGLASTLNEIATSSGVDVVIEELALPARTEVQSECELLGLHPVYGANWVKVVLFVAPEAAEHLLEVLRAHPLGRDAAPIGQATAEHKGMLVARTQMGANRVIPLQIGEQVPRIC